MSCKIYRTIRGTCHTECSKDRNSWAPSPCNLSKSCVPAGYSRRKCNPQLPTVVHWVALRSCKKVHAYQSEWWRQRVHVLPTALRSWLHVNFCTFMRADIVYEWKSVGRKKNGGGRVMDSLCAYVCYGRYSPRVSTRMRKRECTVHIYILCKRDSPYFFASSYISTDWERKCRKFVYKLLSAVDISLDTLYNFINNAK